MCQWCKRVGEGKVTVQPGLYTFDPVDEQISLQGMSPPGRRNVPERVEGRFYFNNPLGTPAQVGKFFDGERIAGIATDRTALLNGSTKIQ